MTEMTPVPEDSSLMIRWKRYEKTEEYANTKKWAVHEEHTDGSLWAAYNQGWVDALKSIQNKAGMLASPSAIVPPEDQI